MFTALRSVANRFMTDTVTIRAASTVAYDEDLGHDVDTAGAEVWTGKAQIRPQRGVAENQAGEQLVGTNRYIVRVPWDATGLERDQVVTVDDSSDPHLEGRALRIIGVEGGTSEAARTLLCEDTLTVTEEEEGS